MLESKYGTGIPVVPEAADGCCEGASFLRNKLIQKPSAILRIYYWAKIFIFWNHQEIVQTQTYPLLTSHYLLWFKSNGTKSIIKIYFVFVYTSLQYRPDVYFTAGSFFSSHTSSHLWGRHKKNFPVIVFSSLAVKHQQNRGILSFHRRGLTTVMCVVSMATVEVPCLETILNSCRQGQQIFKYRRLNRLWYRHNFKFSYKNCLV